MPHVEVEVDDMSLYYLLSVRTWRMEEHYAFQNEVQGRFMELATEAHLRNPDGGNKDRYEELKRDFVILFIGKIREAYNSGGLDAA